MREHQSEKGCVEIEEWGFASLYTLDWGFKKTTLYTYVLVAKILRNGAKSRYIKAGFKNYRNMKNFRQAVKTPKSWNLMGFAPKKYIPSAKTLYAVDLSNTIFNYLCVVFLTSCHYLCHFSYTTPLYLFSSNITYSL